MSIPSNAAILLHQTGALIRASKNDTLSRFDSFNDAVLEALGTLSTRISTLENSSGGSSNPQAQYFSLDDDGDLCQNLGFIDTNVYVVAGSLYVDGDGDLCQEDTDNNEQQIS